MYYWPVPCSWDMTELDVLLECINCNVFSWMSEPDTGLIALLVDKWSVLSWGHESKWCMAISDISSTTSVRCFSVFDFDTASMTELSIHVKASKVRWVNDVHPRIKFSKSSLGVRQNTPPWSSSIMDNRFTCFNPAKRCNVCPVIHDPIILITRHCKLDWDPNVQWWFKNQACPLIVSHENGISATCNRFSLVIASNTESPAVQALQTWKDSRKGACRNSHSHNRFLGSCTLLYVICIYFSFLNCTELIKCLGKSTRDMSRIRFSTKAAYCSRKEIMSLPLNDVSFIASISVTPGWAMRCSLPKLICCSPGHQSGRDDKIFAKRSVIASNKSVCRDGNLGKIHDAVS